MSLRNQVLSDFNREGMQLLKKSKAFNTALEEFVRKGGDTEKLKLINKKNHNHHLTAQEKISPFRPKDEEEAPYIN